LQYLTGSAPDTALLQAALPDSAAGTAEVMVSQVFNTADAASLEPIDQATQDFPAVRVRALRGGRPRAPRSGQMPCQFAGIAMPSA
jgi:hypothetical protein